MDADCMNPNRQCIGCQVKSPLFCLLTEAEMRTVDKNRLTVEFRQGETIRKQGTHLTDVISLNRGYAKLYLEGVRKTSSILHIVKPTSFIGDPGQYLDHIHHVTVTALTDATVCFISLPVFNGIIDENKAFRDAFLAEMSRNILAGYNRLLLLVQKQMPGRMADTLLYLFDEVYGTNNIPLYLTKQDLADLSGMSKEGAIKVIREFQHEEIITLSGEEMSLLDRAKLLQISKVG